MNKKLQLKNVLFGILIGLMILLIIGFSWCYLYIFKPLKEAEEIRVQAEVFEQRLEEHIKLQQNQQDN